MDQKPEGEQAHEGLETREIQWRTLAAVVERLSNITTAPTSNLELRELGGSSVHSAEEDLKILLDNLSRFSKNLKAAADLLASGQLESLPHDPRDPKYPDLMYTDYTQQSTTSKRK